jgi:hypothetical protein
MLLRFLSHIPLLAIALGGSYFNSQANIILVDVQDEFP